ncbi:hypothetical protein RZR97_02765 [Hydrogenimonas thermophila]|uniref:hypothetical protein n=1 Tax=Hydrogenimonas thermophila TaxID=223786 RepID=UPI002936F278|nr:hypothetical protein [Hydrogenimonas thermophila]WOE70503.1 hypothetical protein RZR91_02785 [Hydrogenimonas thermophila]WOE73019.1 hypothetical protein RZR97_02765 [Hydrogenimonas thermophila]
MKKFFLGMVVAGTVAFAAGSVSTTVPITINYTGGCEVSNLLASYDLGTAPAIVDNSNPPVMNPISFDVKCTNGLAYTINLNKETFLPKVGDSTYGITFYADSTMTQKVGMYTSSTLSKTGTGAVETITLYPKLTANGGSCILLPSGQYACESGAISTTVDVTLTW